jgi:hypothetical protein
LPKNSGKNVAHRSKAMAGAIIPVSSVWQRWPKPTRRSGLVRHRLTGIENRVGLFLFGLLRQLEVFTADVLDDCASFIVVAQVHGRFPKKTVCPL